jgi:hypothetical protein
MFSAIMEFTLIDSAIGPNHPAGWTHDVALPLTSVLPAVAPSVAALTVHATFHEFTLVHATITPNKSPIAILLTVLEPTLEH